MRGRQGNLSQNSNLSLVGFFSQGVNALAFTVFSVGRGRGCMFLLLEKALRQGDAGACNKRLSAGTEPLTAKGMWAGHRWHLPCIFHVLKIL